MTVLTPRTYSASTQFFVSTADTSDNAQLAQGSAFTQARVISYTQLITTEKVLGPVRDSLKISAPVSALASHVTASAPTNTVLINVTVTDRSPGDAARIANSIGSVFPDVVANLERVSTTKSSPVKVSVVQPASYSPTPVSPKPVLNVAFGAILGLLLGLALAVIRDRMDNRIRTSAEVKELTNTTILGQVPFDSDANTHPLSLQSDPHSARAEAYRTLRTNLQFVDAARHPRSLAITSSVAGEGKSSTATNLATMLAEAGSSVCIVEGDLRRPRMLDYFGLEGGVGLTDVLIGRVDLADVVQRYSEAPLWVLGAGQLPPNPSELLGSVRMREVLDQLVAGHDYVIVDCPPVVPVTDAAIIGTLVDGIIVVAGASIVTRDHLKITIDRLSKVTGQLIGVVVNRVPRQRDKNNDYSYYSYRPAEPDKRSKRRALARSRG